MESCPGGAELYCDLDNGNDVKEECVHGCHKAPTFLSFELPFMGSSTGGVWIPVVMVSRCDAVRCRMRGPGAKGFVPGDQALQARRPAL